LHSRGPYFTLYTFFTFSSTVFTILCIVSYLYCMLCLCDRVDNVPFEGDQEQAYEEDFQQLAEEGKWLSLSAYSDFIPLIAC
jgi:hypothetical protein